MTKLVKTDHAIVPATSLAGKVEEALAERRDDLLAVAKSFRKCTHPLHDDNESCRGRAFACHSDCPCCSFEGDNLIPAPLGDALNRMERITDKLLDSLTPREREVLRERFGVLPPVPPAPDPKDWAAALGEARVDAVGPGIALTVEPLTPVLREWAKGSSEIAAKIEKRRVDVGIPAGEVTATLESAKIITGKDGRPQLAVEMKVAGTGQKLTSVMPRQRGQ